MYDTIIIGAGMSGLAAGIRLAYFDQKVCVLERHNTIGGLNSFYRLGGRDYDVGLHAVTNYTERGAKKGPLARLLRQLRFQWDDFALAPQIESAVAFSDVTLRFGNNPRLLESEIARAFPRDIDGFLRLRSRLIEYDDLDENAFRISTRSVLEETIQDPLLREMLLCPLMWYGNAREDDMDWGQFCIMFRSIFLEGLARPFRGVRLILKNLIRRYRELGGELRLRSGVDHLRVENGRVTGVVLDDGEILESRRVLSSAGWIETMRMCDDVSQPSIDTRGVAGRLSFVEAIAVLEKPPRQFGHDKTIVFYNDSRQFHWHKPEDSLCDVRTGVICSPNNFHYPETLGELPDSMIRITSLANYDRWMTLSDDEYRLRKLQWFERIAESAVRFMPDFRRHVVATDMFTPKTIRRFTWHTNGTVYGAPDKHFDGRTHLPNLFICGTDQGFVGIIGTIISGITIANQHLLRDTAV